MEFIGIMFSLFFAAIITAIFSLALKNTGPWGGFWIFFILMFFISLAAGEWAAQRGPSAWGYYWAPGLIAAIIVALVLASAAPGSSPRKGKLSSGSEETVNEASASIAAAVLGIFFWILIVVLAVIAIAGLAGRM